MMKSITNTLGVLLALVGIIGFFNHGFMGMNLNPLHDVLLLILGGVSLYFGIKGTEFQARNWNRALGGVLAIVGIIGLFMHAGTVTISDLDGRYSSHLLPLIKGHLEFG